MYYNTLSLTYYTSYVNLYNVSGRDNVYRIDKKVDGEDLFVGEWKRNFQGEDLREKNPGRKEGQMKTMYGQD